MSRPPTQATRLLELAAAAELFHSPSQEAFGTIRMHDHAETWPLRSRTFRLWLHRRFHQATGTIPNGQATQDALNVLIGQALFGGRLQPVATRCAEHEQAIYLDRGDPDWTAIRVTASGWALVATPPVKFVRPRGMLPLPAPVPGGRIAALRRFLNIVPEDFALLVAWLLAALRPRGPYPVLVLHGEQGSAKSTTARVLRALVDPHAADLRTEPRDVRDVMIAAKNSWVLSLDNLSHLPAWLSDALCRLATGGGFATRALFTDAEELLVAAMRPVILNGIEELATRGDLLDRSLLLELPPIAPGRRQAEAAVWAAFEAARPRLLGALLDALVGALRTSPGRTLPTLPRMADFALWVTAAEPALGWRPGTFLAAYTRNREAANGLALDASPLATALRDFLARGDRAKWAGTAAELLDALAARGPASVLRQPGWPRSPRGLSGTLRRLAPNLRAVGLAVSFAQSAGSNSRRLVTLRRIGADSDATDATDARTSTTS